MSDKSKNKSKKEKNSDQAEREEMRDETHHLDDEKQEEEDDKLEEEQYEEEHPYIHPALLSVKFTFQSSDAEISPNIERLAAKRVFMDNSIKTINE